MIPWLHFTGGSVLFFESWEPNTPGAIAGTCIGLLALAVFERWVNGMRGIVEAKWKKRALALMSSKANVRGSATDSAAAPPSATRTYPPFIPSHDIPRGALFAFQALLYYLLMLAVMTFQAGFIIAIVGGLMIGEVLFGRFNAVRAHV
ncbi:Ctr copper transporter [Epithele typhae]|uniref:Ctr copper transporter n=1 Tax=Epithele typhae TaxID=378194 RepID=UPI002008A118|nr:Ctr copper transporter [Epithele typhae]KAH9921949.1 Ctr copper transporter [Epithele typhae]